ncbi:MAG: hypothetical protein V1738_00290 [Patescibacteria group bacterium]
MVNRKIILIISVALAVLALAVIILLSFASAPSLPVSVSPSADISDGGSTAITSTSDPDLTGQEKATLTLNFLDEQVVFTGYPYVDKFAPHLFNLMFVGQSVSDELSYGEQLSLSSRNWWPVTDSSGNWSGTYEYSKQSPKIFIPIGRSASGEPIWQTMDIVASDKLFELLPNCTGHEFELLGGLSAVSYQCEANEVNQAFANSQPCYLPISDEIGILYRQFSAETSSIRVDMCDVLKRNYIVGVEVRPY